MGLITTTITEFRNNIRSFINDVIDEHSTIIIPRKKQGIVVMSLDDYNSIMETAHLLSSKKNSDRLRESLKQEESNKAESKELL